MRNSDPRVRSVFVHRFSSNFHSMFTLRATSCDSQYGSNFGVPSNPTFRVSWIFVSWQSVLTTCLWFCKIVRTRQCALSWSIVRLQLSPGILHQYKILSHDFAVRAFPLVPCNFCKKISCAGISVEGVGVVINNFAGSNNGSDCPANTGLTHRSCLTSTVFFLPQIWDCSVDNELINSNNCAKNNFNRITIGTEVYR